jgi:copper homeostasis protein
MIEICCGSYEDAYNAYLGGAKQIELNSALYLGGLTPTIASLVLTKQNTDLKVICMTRPRGAGFCYTEIEFQQMLEDAKILLEHGADGIVFGCLTPDFMIDEKQTKTMIDLIKSYQKEVVFHRAFDCVKNPYSSIELLIHLGVDRVLTSGLQPTAYEGKELLKTLEERYGNDIQLLAGSGINVNNVIEFKNYTKMQNVHSSCKIWKEDVTTIGDSVSYSYAPSGNEKGYEYVSKELVERLIAIVNER